MKSEIADQVVSPMEPRSVPHDVDEFLGGHKKSKRPQFFFVCPRAPYKFKVIEELPFLVTLRCIDWETELRFRLVDGRVRYASSTNFPPKSVVCDGALEATRIFLANRNPPSST
jgi:hypothetical protein